MKKKRVETNIDLLPNGKYQVDLYLTNRISKKRQRVRKTFSTLSEARMFRQEQFSANELRMWKGGPRQHVTLKQSIELAKEEKIRTYRKKNPTEGQDARPKSFSDIERHLEEIEAFFGANLMLTKITETRIDEFIQYLRTRPKKKTYHRGKLSNQSVDHTLKELRYTLRLAHRHEFLTEIPNINFLGNYDEREFDLELDDFINVVNFLPVPPKPHQALMLMALNTGQRSSDLSEMEWRQIKKNHVVYRSSKTQKRGIRAPLLNVTREALERLKQSRSQSEKIFVNPGTGKPIVDVRKALTTACHKAEVPRFTLHHLRHLATTVLLEFTNGDRDLVKRIIGWSDMSMIERYGHIGGRAQPVFAALDQSICGRLKL